MKNILSILLLYLALVGCDPAKMLLVKASKMEGVSVTVYGNDKFDTDISQSSSKVIRVPSDDSVVQRKKRFYYGLGGWSDEGIKHFAAGIDSIIFTNASGKTVLSTHNEIEGYLLKHRGLFKLTIEAK